MRVIAALSLTVTLIGSVACGGGTTPTPEPAAVQAPPAELQAGALLFAAKCSECHGAMAEGTDKGPPFIHALYVPGHHGDDAFVNAALNGVAAHHWQFGDMPPVEGITEPEVRQIVPYVRWLQGQQGSP